MTGTSSGEKEIWCRKGQTKGTDKKMLYLSCQSFKIWITINVTDIFGWTLLVFNCWLFHITLELWKWLLSCGNDCWVVEMTGELSKGLLSFENRWVAISGAGAVNCKKEKKVFPFLYFLYISFLLLVDLLLHRDTVVRSCTNNLQLSRRNHWQQSDDLQLVRMTVCARACEILLSQSHTTWSPQNKTAGCTPIGVRHS